MATKTITRYRSRPRKRARRRAKMTLPLALIGPVGALGVKSVQQGIQHGPTEGINYLTGALTGYRPDWKEKGWIPFHSERLRSGAFPILLGVLVHKIAGVTGVNRALGRAKVPYLRI